MKKVAQVVKTQICPAKRKPSQPVDTLTLRADGIEGDWHQGKGDRAVCLWRKEIVDWIDGQNGGLCFQKQKENLLVEGFDENTLKPGTKLYFREAVLEIADFPKRCFPEDCAYTQSGAVCRLRDEYQMAKILTPGTIRLGEKVYLAPWAEER